MRLQELIDKLSLAPNLRAKTITVQELIDELSKVKNKKQAVVINASGEEFSINNLDVCDGKVWIESSELY